MLPLRSLFVTKIFGNASYRSTGRACTSSHSDDHDKHHRVMLRARVLLPCIILHCCWDAGGLGLVVVVGFSFQLFLRLGAAIPRSFMRRVALPAVVCFAWVGDLPETFFSGLSPYQQFSVRTG